MAIVYIVLAVAAVLALTAAIIAVAPYAAIILVLGLAAYFLSGKEDPPNK